MPNVPWQNCIVSWILWVFRHEPITAYCTHDGTGNPVRCAIHRQLSCNGIGIEAVKDEHTCPSFKAAQRQRKWIRRRLHAAATKFRGQIFIRAADRVPMTMGGALTYTFCGAIFNVPAEGYAIIETVETPSYDKMHGYAVVALESWKKIAVLDNNKKYIRLTGFSHFLHAFKSRMELFESAKSVRSILARNSESRADNLVFGVIRFLIVTFKGGSSAGGEKEVSWCRYLCLFHIKLIE
jgi:hypothetical protein